jgi:hypothetical protein
MDIIYVAYVYAVAVGIVAAGVTGSLWALATGERPRFGLLLEPSATAPLRGLVVIIHAPVMLFMAAWRFAGNPFAGLLIVAASLGWSFLQGVFILTQFFGVT